MSLSFDEAKLRYNPDPNWFPSRNSEDYKQILELQKQSGYISLSDRIGIAPKEVPHSSYLVAGEYKHPLVRTIPEHSRSAISKNKFLSVKSNKEAVELHETENGRPIEIISRPPLPKTPLLPIIQRDTKKMSKEEFLKIVGVKAYVEHHIQKNKK